MEKRRLLIVGDDANDFLLLKRVLRAFECSHAPSLQAARAALADGGYDGCILEDTIDGKPALVLLRECRELDPQMPAIVVTGHDDEGLVREARALGARGVLRKGGDDEATIGHCLFGAATPDAQLAPRGRLRVLIVDDEPLMLRSMQRTLSRLHAVTITTESDHALALVSSGAGFDLLLADVVMPTKHGVKLCEEVQRLAPRTRVALMTGGIPTCLHDVDLKQCGIPCLDKPFSQSDLIAFVGAQLADAASEPT